ncbi:MAG: PKD domain-containing protein [Flavobacteriales bacterium]|nr:PKD domain-containing protein [Flavobacteriales bacterium]
MKTAIVQILAVSLLTPGIALAQYVPAGTSDFPTEPTIEQYSDDIGDEMEMPQAFANAVNSLQSGDWNAPGTWDCGCVPSQLDDVNINTGHDITMNLDAHVNGLFIDADASLTVLAGGLTMIVDGDWVNSGQFIPSDGHVTFGGTEDQSITGLTAFNTLTLSGTQGVSVISDITIGDVLLIDGSTLHTNGRVTLATDGTKTASLAQMTSGSIDGPLGVVYSAHPSNTGWLTVAAPYTDVQFDQWNDDMVTTGFEGADYPNYSFVSIQYYDETLESSFQGITSAYDITETGRGYYVYANSGNYTLDLIGSPTVGDFTFPTTYTSTGNPLDDGLNVLGNPYLCDINWEADGAWTKTNINGAIYIWDVSQNQFRVFINGFGINGGSPIIKNGEAFWVQTNNDSPELSVNESAKVTDWTPITNTTDNFLMLSMTGNNTTDEMIVAFDDAADMAYLPSEDAFKFYSDANVPNIGTKSSDEIVLAVNTIPAGEGNIDIPVAIHSPNGGTFEITVAKTPELGFQACLSIEDLLTGDEWEIAEGNMITFTTDPVEEDIRFILHVGAMLPVATADISCNGMGDGALTVSGTGDGPWNFTVMDGQGNTVAQLTDIDTEAMIDNLASGDYTVMVENNDYCAALTQDFSISEPDSIYIVDATIGHVDCGDQNTGSITIEAMGGSGNLDYLWNTGQTTASIGSLEGGPYSVVIMDENGCTHGETYEVEVAPTVVASFVADNQVIDLINGEATVVFSNNTTNATEFAWDFGDGTALSTDENPSHTYTQPGAYVVELVANNDSCDDTYQVVIQVQEVVNGVEETEFTSGVHLLYQNGQIVIQFDFNQAYDIQIDGYNTLGQRIIDPMSGTYSEGNVILPLRQRVPVGIISITNTSTGEIKSYKIIH